MAKVRIGGSASKHVVVMESASSIKEAEEQSGVVMAPPKRCEGCGKQTHLKCSKCNFFAY